MPNRLSCKHLNRDREKNETNGMKERMEKRQGKKQRSESENARGNERTKRERGE